MPDMRCTSRKRGYRPPKSLLTGFRGDGVFWESVLRGVRWDHTCILCAVLSSQTPLPGSHPTSSPSRSHVSSAFRTCLEFDHSSPWLIQAAVLSRLIMASVFQLAFPLLPLTSVLHTTTRLPRSEGQASSQNPPAALRAIGVKATARGPCDLAPPGLFDPMSCLRSHLSPLWVPQCILSISANTLHVLLTRLIIIIISLSPQLQVSFGQEFFDHVIAIPSVRNSTWCFGGWPHQCLLMKEEMLMKACCQVGSKVAVAFLFPKAKL